MRQRSLWHSYGWPLLWIGIALYFIAYQASTAESTWDLVLLIMWLGILVSWTGVLILNMRMRKMVVEMQERLAIIQHRGVFL